VGATSLAPFVIVALLLLRSLRLRAAIVVPGLGFISAASYTDEEKSRDGPEESVRRRWNFSW
jgi:hypothetical protein